MDETIILLHGALGSSAQMKPLEKILEKDFKVINNNLPGHGLLGEESKFCINIFMEDVASRIPTGEKVFVFGYSMGGYVALKLGLEYPERIQGIITLGTQLKWNPEIAEKECRMLNPETVKIKVPAFAEELRKRHNNWENVMARTADLLRDIGNSPLQSSDYSNINTLVQLMVGDQDKMVSIEETVDAFRNIPGARLAVLPGTPHPFEKADLELLQSLVKRYISSSGR